jgi:hypothetical protein
MQAAEKRDQTGLGIGHKVYPIPEHAEITGYVVSYVGDEHPPGTGDPDWLRQFADEGGTAIVSVRWRRLFAPPSRSCAAKMDFAHDAVGSVLLGTIHHHPAPD